MFMTFILPVIVAVVASFIIGMIWYSPVLFAKAYQQELGMTKDSKMPPMVKSFALGIFGDILLAFVFFTLVVFLGAFTFKQIFLVGFFMWVGGMVPILLGDIAWAGRSWKFFGINAGYRIASVATMSLVFCLFIK
jgi:hypothetical protein